jgi:chromatin segregation and condensation protein Rec8/ScpA/Scc1 (kleisin family)
MKTYPYQTPEGIIELVEKRELDQLLERLDKAEELIREIRDDEVNAQDEADKFLRDHKPSELAKMRLDNAELLERLRERTESHLAASARDVQTIQQQAVMIRTLANALTLITEEYEDRRFQFGDEYLWQKHEGSNPLPTAFAALDAYKLLTGKRP